MKQCLLASGLALVVLWLPLIIASNSTTTSPTTLQQVIARLNATASAGAINANGSVPGISSGTNMTLPTAAPTDSPTVSPGAGQVSVGSVMDAKLKSVDKILEILGRQIIDLQTFVEERIRSDGQSGVKITRQVHGGTRNYYIDNHISDSAVSAHDHADYEYVLGLGEFVAVMNGVEFRTRHNDYMFVQPSHTREFNAVDRIAYPDMPPEVTQKATLQEQILELREWFKAFKDQDYSVRDYRKYFKPNLCYLEGGWTLSSRDQLQEPFGSDRHMIDAASWFDLSEKIRFSSYIGHMNALENFAWLPTTVYNISKDGEPQVAQWNYRILCHPLDRDLPTSYFRLQDDLAYRMAHKLPMEKIPELRAARFILDEFGTDRETEYTLLDELMHQIPGKDNYGVNMTDDAFGLMNFDVTTHGWSQKPVNVGYYHRLYKVGLRGAMGGTMHYRGFNDPNMWVAETTQKEIMPVTIKYCQHEDDCVWQTRRATYAIPLEVMYTTPLNKWNPYNFDHHSPTVSEKKDRDGRISRLHAFNGTSYRHYYWTPIEFYHDNYNISGRPTSDAVGILDPQGNVRVTATSGITILTPDIDGVGKVRLRYPIFPVHFEGSPMGEEFGALKEMVMHMKKYNHLYEDPPFGTDPAAASSTVKRTIQYRMGQSTINPPGYHGHDVTLTLDDYVALLNGKPIKIQSSQDLSHSHDLDLQYDAASKTVVIKTCDGQATCWDGHPNSLTRV